MLSDWRSIYIFSNLNPISASTQTDNVMSKQALFMLHYGREMVQDQDVEVYGGLIILETVAHILHMSAKSENTCQVKARI